MIMWVSECMYVGVCVCEWHGSDVYIICMCINCVSREGVSARNPLWILSKLYPLDGPGGDPHSGW